MSTLDLTADAHKQRRETLLTPVTTTLDMFYARFDYLYVGLAVVCTETSTDVWDVTTYPGTLDISTGGAGIGVGQDINAADFVFYGTNTYTVSGSLATALTNGGYTVS